MDAVLAELGCNFSFTIELFDKSYLSEKRWVSLRTIAIKLAGGRSLNWWEEKEKEEEIIVRQRVGLNWIIRKNWRQLLL